MTLLFPTLRAAVHATQSDGPYAVRCHHFVKLRSGRWCRTFGPPGPGAVHVRGKVWRVAP